MSQDILFHYCFNFSGGGDWSGLNKDWLPSFVRALIAKPSLGKQVRIMGLFKYFFPLQYHLFTRQDLQSWSDVSAKYQILVPGEVTGALLQQRHEGSILFFNEPGPDAQLLHSGEANREVPSAFYRWLHILALNLVPRITHLQLTSPLGSFEDLQSPAPTFTQLRVLTYDEFSEVEGIIESQIHFPNVSRLWAGSHLRSAGRAIQAPNPMINIRKLSVFSTPRALSVLLQFCPNLEDLECHANPCPWMPEPISSLEWPEHTKNGLRRLAWSNEDAIGNVKDNNVDGAYIVPLLDFKRLEILEIDQSSILLYSKLLEAKSLGSVLPGTLRILHIVFALDVSSNLQIGRQLRKLAQEKAMLLPKLSIVKVNGRHRPLSKKKTLEESMNVTGVVNLLGNVGIDLKFGQDAGPYFDTTYRCILPPPPGVAKRDCLISFQSPVFSLDD